MSQSAVILKSNPYGLVLNLNSDLPFEELRKAVGEKFRESAGFFKNAKLALTFRGRALTKEEENQLVEEVVENSRIQVVCIVDEEKQSAEFYRRAVEKSLEKKKEEDGYFYRGTLRSGQELETVTSIVVIGDVNPDKRARSAIVKKKDTGEYPLDPKMAYIKDDHLQFKPITSENLCEYLT